MNTSNSSDQKKDLQKLNRLKSVLFLSTIVFIIRYLLLIFSIYFSEVLVVFSISILFIIQIPVLIIGFIMLSYGLMGIKEFLVLKRNIRMVKSVVISLMTIIALILLVLVGWLVAGLAPIESIPDYGLDLWYQSIIIAMPFVELLPLTLGLSLLSLTFWRLRKKEGWKTNILIIPFLFIPLTIVRIVAAILKIINIINPPKFEMAWELSDISRVIYGVLGIVTFIEIAIRFWNLNPKLIISNLELSHQHNFPTTKEKKNE
ncbi:MAG TPA: hypothetical protein VMX55_03125 [candidate division Zixibacteria bacterium]|nr:hypothetical protein [candidate division Zixibacteria bacterium]